MDSGTVRESLGIIQQPDLVHPRKMGGVRGQTVKATGDIVAFLGYTRSVLGGGGKQARLLETL